MKPNRCLPFLAPALMVGLLSGCLDRELRPLNPCTLQGNVESVKVDNIENVDLLFMMDNSGSMSQEQTAVAREIPNLVRVLASGDIDGDGEQDFPPVVSLNVGIISSDMGTGGVVVQGACERDPNFGDDGVLRNTGNVAISGCAATYDPNFLNFRPADGGDPVAFAADVECLAVLGTNGCGFEQQLEAVLKAVTPSTSAITFGMGTVGHADGQNRGFLRDDSLLVVLMITDEDDCSALDPDVYNRMSTRYPAPELNLRCFQYPEAVHPVERYTQGLLATRADPDLLIFAAITGIPDDLNPNPEGPIDYAAILADEDMQERVNPMMPQELAPSCDRPGTGRAFPPRRILTLAQQLEAGGANSLVQTICQDDYTGAIQGVINKIADVLGGTCLPRTLNRDASGRVNCDVVEVLPSTGDIVNCTSIAGRELIGTEVDEMGNTHEVCRVQQLTQSESAMPGAVGWFYDDFSADVTDRCPMERPQRIAFANSPATGTTVRLECLQTISGSMGAVGVGTGCGGDPNVCTTGVPREVMEAFPMGLFCSGTECPAGDTDCEERATLTCQGACNTDADCPGGFSCFDFDGEGPLRPLCTNPTCTQ